ncbi:MAG TPA: FimV/HubP family polar landmark protein [Burkholderiales bacterium]|nr:FimV/HubP family polar landmark protein [Burkholderiales bacterium]
MAVVALPGLAQAAGLGKLTVMSALGEPLSAEIELVNIQKEELSSLNAKVASREAFSQARLEYLSLLSSLKFSIELRGDATPYIKLTSTQPINEPFVDMLVELTWSSGKLLREYTFLLDPPSLAPRAAVPEAKPVPPVVAPAPQAAPSAEVKAPAAAEPVAPAKPAREPAAPVAATAKAGDTWTVKRGDTLSAIALATKPAGVNLDQMLVALYRANRDAFVGNNMNRLKTGPILRIPEGGEVASTDKVEARGEVRAQAVDWNAYRQNLAAAAAAPAGEAPKQAVAGKVTTKVEEKAPAAEPSKEVLKLSKGEPPAGAKDTRDLRAKVQSLQEENLAKEKALQESNERVAQLEKNIKEMQKLLELKGAPPAPQPEAPKPEVTKPAAPQPEAAKPEAAKPDAPIPAEAPKPVEAPKPAAAKPAPKPAPPSREPSLLEDPMVAGAGAAILALIGVGGFLAYRRKKQAAAAAAFSEAAAPVFHQEPVAAAPVAAEAPPKEEVDTLAEADVYLAYGRDAQAEEILKEALARQPGRTEIHTKLLEVYAKRGDKGAFEQTANALKALGVTGAAWESVKAMGLALDPQNTLYGGVPAATPAPAEVAPEAPTAEAAAAAGEKGELSIDFDLGAINTDAETAAAGKAAPAAEAAADVAGENLVFDITAVEPQATFPMEPQVDVPISGGEGKALDLSLPSLDLGGASPTPSVTHDARWQEVATKFDLAKVYKEMGDKDGAREILQEVIREGDAQQQEEAKALLASL